MMRRARSVLTALCIGALSASGLATVVASHAHAWGANEVGYYEMSSGQGEAYETGPINVNAINLPNGGVDFGLFGYWAQLVHDDDGLAKATVTQVVSASGSSRTAAKKA